MSQQLVLVPIAKIDESRQEVWGFAAEEVPDKSSEIMDFDASKPNFMRWSEGIFKASQGKSKGNLRGMHQSIAAGKVIDLQFIDNDKKIFIGTKVVDPVEWKKVLEGVYTGFSIGGNYGKRWADGPYTRYEAIPTEISLVDNPAMYGATFTFVKADGVTVESVLGKGESKGHPFRGNQYTEGQSGDKGLEQTSSKPYLEAEKKNRIRSGQATDQDRAELVKEGLKILEEEFTESAWSEEAGYAFGPAEAVADRYGVTEEEWEANEEFWEDLQSEIIGEYNDQEIEFESDEEAESSDEELSSFVNDLDNGELIEHYKEARAEGNDNLASMIEDRAAELELDLGSDEDFESDVTQAEEETNFKNQKALEEAWTSGGKKAAKQFLAGLTPEGLESLRVHYDEYGEDQDLMQLLGWPKAEKLDKELNMKKQFPPKKKKEEKEVPPEEETQEETTEEKPSEENTEAAPEESSDKPGSLREAHGKTKPGGVPPTDELPEEAAENEPLLQDDKIKKVVLDVLVELGLVTQDNTLTLAARVGTLEKGVNGLSKLQIAKALGDLEKTRTDLLKDWATTLQQLQKRLDEIAASGIPGPILREISVENVQFQQKAILEKMIEETKDPMVKNVLQNQLATLSIRTIHQEK